ncbi:hypothetical protein NMG60_11033103 [Bertholletia excelsa]
MEEASSTSTTEAGPTREEQEVERSNNRVVVPDDGFEWKKYGQKFIRSINKNRIYYKCQKSHCKAKKKAEWSSSDPDNLRVVYEGDHNHEDPPPANSSQEPSNPYNLYTQVFGDPPPDRPSRRRS